MLIFLQGLTLGLAYVAPIGMQNMFVINSALTQKKRRSYFVAFATVFFDVALALACFLGMGALIEYVPLAEKLILLVGSLLVIYIGISMLRAKVGADKSKNVDMPLFKVISTAFVVTWLNPQAIIDGTMLLGAFRVTLPGSEGWIFLFGVMLASIIWFFGITILVQVFGSKFSPSVIKWINIVCGAVIIAYGLKLLVNFFQLVF
ncbi:L-lysine permease [Actinomycetota bacterium]|nr:L-lysine permease [Actinomycetota bacterium]